MNDRKRPSNDKNVVLSDESREALRIFADAPTVRERVAGLKRLFNAKQMAAVRQQPEYGASLAWCAERARDLAAPGDERLLGFAALVTVRRSNAGDEATLTAEIKSALGEPLPSLDLLEDSKDQERVLAAVRELRPPWALEYALPRTTIEATQSNARWEAIATVLVSTPTLEDACEALVTQLRRRGERLGATAFAKLVFLVLLDLDGTIEEVAPTPGEHPAVGLVHLAEVIRANELRSTALADQAQVVEALAQVVRRVAGVRLRAALDSATYEPLVILRSTLAATWPALVARAKSLAAVRADVTEALYVQVRAGVPDARLHRVLAALHGDAGGFEQTLNALAKEPGVPDAMVRWLTGAAEASDTLTNSLERINAEAERVPAAAILAAATAVDDYNFEHPSSLTVPRAIVEPVVREVLAFAERRRLSIDGRAGDVVSFDPVRHEAARLPPGGLTLVRLLTPVVIEQRGEGHVIVVLKAAVEHFELESA